MRIADKMAFEQVKSNISKNRSQMSDLQNQAATQKRVTKPSDDPLAASRVLTNRIDLQGNQQFTKSLNYAKSFIEFSDQSLGDLTEVLSRAKELAVSQSSDASANEESRRVVATEVEQLYNQMVTIGNRKLGDRFIFGGFKTQNAPFDPQGQYNGDNGEMMIHIDKESFVPMNMTGGRVFHGAGLNENGMPGKTTPQPESLEQLEQQRQAAVQARGPASLQTGAPSSVPGGAAPEAEVSGRFENGEPAGGVNLFTVMKEFEIALRTNDKEGVQSVLDSLDGAISQVVLARAQVGSRATTLDNILQTVEKQKVDNKSAISSLEDADVYSTVSDINKTESTLQATLQTSGKLVQQSLMDFLR